MQSSEENKQGGLSFPSVTWDPTELRLLGLVRNFNLLGHFDTGLEIIYVTLNSMPSD